MQQRTVDLGRGGPVYEKTRRTGPGGRGRPVGRARDAKLIDAAPGDLLPVETPSGKHATNSEANRGTAMSTGTTSPGRAKISARTLRTDRWWVWPLLNAAGLAFFLVYGTFRIFYDQNYWVEEFHYLAPFYSPCLSNSCVEGSSHFLGTPLPSLPSWMSPAMFILVFPGGFRATCYYYRKTYYRAFWFSPPACAVAEPHKAYSGETRFPLIFQNVHRYFFYFALVVAGLLTYDAFIAFHGKDGGFGIGLGTVILAVNVVLLSSYTLGCHSVRHLVGGHKDEVSKSPIKDACYGCSTALNNRHQLFAYMSLFSVAFADVFVRLCSMGIWSDVRFL